jgi:hypothetical protein
MTIRCLCTCGLLTAFVLLAGCQRLNYEKTLKVSPGEYPVIDFDAPRSEQKVTVQVTSPGVPISAYLVKESDKTAANEALDRAKAPAALLGSKEKAEDIQFEATVPARTGYTLLLRSNKATDVKIKVTGR